MKRTRSIAVIVFSAMIAASGFGDPKHTYVVEHGRLVCVW
jgi:hypothetical protein